MIKRIISIVFLVHLMAISQGQHHADRLDSLVEIAISKSESALYEAKFYESLRFLENNTFNVVELTSDQLFLLIMAQLRVNSFIKRVLNTGDQDLMNSDTLYSLRSLSSSLCDQNILGAYYLYYSDLLRSENQLDSAHHYENLSMKIFSDNNNCEMLANLRSSAISRMQLQLESSNQIDSLIHLIPEYEKEILFSEKHSKYITSFNTRHLANIYFRQLKDYNKALEYYNRSLKLREEIGFKPFLPASYYSIGAVYLESGKSARALEMFLQSAKLAEEIGFTKYLCDSHIGIGDSYLAMGEFHNAQKYYKMAFHFAEERNYTPGINRAKEKIKALQ